MLSQFVARIAGDPRSRRKTHQRPERSGEFDKLYLEGQGEHVNGELDGHPHHEICDKDRQGEVAAEALERIIAYSQNLRRIHSQKNGLANFHSPLK